MKGEVKITFLKLYFTEMEELWFVCIYTPTVKIIPHDRTIVILYSEFIFWRFQNNTFLMIMILQFSLIIS